MIKFFNNNPSHLTKEVDLETIMSLIQIKCDKLSSVDSIKFLMELDNRLYQLEGQASVRYGKGKHTKHKHIKYHDFFTKNILKGENILDVGSSRGELTSDIAIKADPGLVYGIEIVDFQVEEARRMHQMDNLHFILGDATKDTLPNIKFDVITLSNVLEHIDERVAFLRSLIEQYHPKRFLIRVPMFERDWRVPLKKELGIDHRLDDTHFIEYTKENFTLEITEAGLRIEELDVRWGEFWAVLTENHK